MVKLMPAKSAGWGTAISSCLSLPALVGGGGHTLDPDHRAGFSPPPSVRLDAHSPAPGGSYGCQEEGEQLGSTCPRHSRGSIVQLERAFSATSAAAAPSLSSSLGWAAPAVFTWAVGID